MTGTMTWVGLDVHARSTHAAAIDTLTGELTRKRFGPGVDEPVAWLAGLAGPIKTSGTSSGDGPTTVHNERMSLAPAHERSEGEGGVAPRPRLVGA
jgi:hypothetical protein